MKPQSNVVRPRTEAPLPRPVWPSVRPSRLARSASSASASSSPYLGEKNLEVKALPLRDGPAVAAQQKGKVKRGLKDGSILRKGF